MADIRCLKVILFGRGVHYGFLFLVIYGLISSEDGGQK